MTLIQILTWIPIVVLALVLVVWLAYHFSQRWPVDRAAPQVRLWGMYSPFLTWLRFGRLPPAPPGSEMRAGAEAHRVRATAQPSSLAPVDLSEPPTESPRDEGPPQPGDHPRPEGTAAEVISAAGMLERRIDLALALAALALALIGQFFFSRVRGDLLDGAGFFLASVVVFLILAWRSEPRPAAHGPRAAWWRPALNRLRDEPLRVALVVISLALAYTIVRLLRAKPGNESYLDVFSLWVLGCACYAVAFVRLPRGDLRAWWQRHRREAGVVLGLTLAAALLRLVTLGRLPDVISGDEGRIGLLAQSVLAGKITNMMATTFGHSTMYLYLMAASIKAFGASPFGLRLTSALAGALTVPAVYVLARRMFNARVALVAAGLLAASHFHLHFSRVIVAGSIQDALFATVAFYFFLTGLEERSAGRLVASALVIGVHLYIYMGARLVILYLPVYVLALWIADRRLARQNLGNLLTYLGALVVVSAPMAWWAYSQPGEFMARANQVGILQSGWLASEATKLGKSQLAIVLDQLRQAFLTVNYYPAKGFYYSDQPMLDFVSGAVFVLGIAYSLWHVFDRRHLLLQGWFWSGVVAGGALLVLPGDAAYRIMIVFPAVCIFVALGWDRLIEFGSRAVALGPVRTSALTGLFIAALVVPNLKTYFVDYAPTCRYEDWGTRFASKMGTYLGELGPGYTPYLLGAPRVYYGIHPSVDYLSGGLRVTNVDSVLTGPPNFVDPRASAVFILIPEREAELAHIQSWMPGGTLERRLDCQAVQMLIYRVEGAAAQ